MTQTNATTHESGENTSETVDVEIYQTIYGFDRGTDESELAQDLRFDADPDDVTADAIETVYEYECSGEVDLETVRDAEGVESEDVPEIITLEHINKRTQGPRKDEQIGYDGTEMKSLSTGDLVVLDGYVYICARVGFEIVGEKDDLIGSGESRGVGA